MLCQLFVGQPDDKVRYQKLILLLWVKILMRLQNPHAGAIHVVGNRLVALLPLSGELLNSRVLKVRRFENGKDLFAESIIFE